MYALISLHHEKIPKYLILLQISYPAKLKTKTNKQKNNGQFSFWGSRQQWKCSFLTTKQLNSFLYICFLPSLSLGIERLGIRQCTFTLLGMNSHEIIKKFKHAGKVNNSMLTFHLECPVSFDYHHYYMHFIFFLTIPQWKNLIGIQSSVYW